MTLKGYVSKTNTQFILSQFKVFHIYNSTFFNIYDRFIIGLLGQSWVCAKSVCVAVINPQIFSPPVKVFWKVFLLFLRKRLVAVLAFLVTETQSEQNLI